MKYFLSAVIILFLSVCTLFGVGKKDAAINAPNGKPEVAAANFPAYDFVRQIAGDRLNLFMLLPPGTESHSFEPTPRDIIKIQNSALFIYNGGESDAWVDRILESMNKPKTRVIRMMDAVDPVEEEIVEGMEPEEEEEGEEVVYDEHIWTSPKNAVRIVGAIAEGLCGIDPEGAALFRQNARRYIAELEALDREFQAVVDGAKRKTFVFGDRFPFRYFADAYDLAYFAAFPGCSTETDCSASTLAFLINKMKAEKIPVVFYIELSNENIADVIAAETGAKKRLFHAGHNISKRDFDRGLTFLEIQRANVPRLKEALW